MWAVKYSDQWQKEILLGQPSQGLGSCSSLKQLTFKDCNSLSSLLESIKRKSVDVERLTVADCDSLNFIFRGQIPQSLKKLKVRNCRKLQSLSIDDTEDSGSTSLSSISTLACFLKKIPLVGSLHLKQKVNTNTSHLEDLDIRSCPYLTCLPSVHQLSTTLTNLSISDCLKITTLFPSGHLPMALKHLDIWSCSNLTTILPKGHFPKTLETLSLSLCPELESVVEKFHHNSSLHLIFIFFCSNLKSLPEGLETLSSLRNMYIDSCESFASFPEGGLPNTVSSLEIINCPKLEALPIGMYFLSCLEIRNCLKLSLYGAILPNLTSLKINGVKYASFRAVMNWGLDKFTFLTSLHIYGGWPDHESFRADDMKISLPASLTTLETVNFPALKSLPFKDFEDLLSLECLKIESCQQLTSLPSLPFSLLQLHVRGCPSLEQACERGRGKEWYKIADIPCVTIDGKFIYNPINEVFPLFRISFSDDIACLIG